MLSHKGPSKFIVLTMDRSVENAAILRVFEFEMRAAALGASIRALRELESHHRITLKQLESRLGDFLRNTGEPSSGALKAQIESWKGEIALHRRRAELAAGEIARIRPEFETNARLAESTKTELERQRQTARALQLEASFKRNGHGQE